MRVVYRAFGFCFALAAAIAQNAYLPISGINQMVVINTATNTIIATISGLGIESDGVTVTPDGRKVYVTGDPLTVIDTSP